jgi:two-component system OmpR family response regulator
MNVLVVEDDVRMASLLRRGLTAEGWAVDVQGDAEDARLALLSTPYDVVVCDIMLPGRMSGLDLCRSIRSVGVWTPFLMLTARTSVEDRVAGLDAGADDYLGKPFAFTELAARLRALVRRGEPERPMVIEVGPLRLDPARHEVSAHGEVIEFTAREFALLEYLMRRAGEVVTRSDMLDHVWDYAYDGLSNVVDVYIGYVRKKLRAVGLDAMLRTIRGVGYRLDAPAGERMDAPVASVAAGGVTAGVGPSA